MLEHTVTTFIKSGNGKNLSSRRVLFHLPERLVGYNISSEEVVQTVLSPVSVAVCPTPVCVRNCTFCSNTKRNRKNRRSGAQLGSRVFTDLVRDLVSCGVQGVSIAGGGEPLAYDGPLVEGLLLKQDTPFRIGIHTNGVLLGKVIDERIFKCGNITYVNVSVVAHRPQLYRKVCRAPEEQFFMIEKNISSFLKMRARCGSELMPGVKILLSRENYSYAYEIFDYFSRLGVDNILVRCVGNFEPGQDVELLPGQIERVSSIFKERLNMKDDQIIAVTGKSNCSDGLPVPSRCWICALQYTAGVDPDGEVYLCSQWSRSGYSIGNINKRPLTDIWGSDRHKDVARRLNANLRHGRCDPLLCRHYYSNLAIDAFIEGAVSPLPKAGKETSYGRFI